MLPPPLAHQAQHTRGKLRPTWRFVWQHPAHAVALGFGAGLSPIAPGTAGTLWAWLVYLLLLRLLPAQAIALILLACTLLGWWACTRTAQHLHRADPGCIVWDEVLAFWLVLFVWMPAGFWGQLTAFLLFRFFDAAKPAPVRWADRHFKGLGWRGGWGIMLDDLVAAFCTLVLLALWQHAGVSGFLDGLS